MKQEFNLEYQYQLYLKRCGAHENRMGEIQKKEMRQTFMGACGQIIILLRDEVAKYEEKEAVEILQSMLNQVGDFFLKSQQKQN